MTARRMISGEVLKYRNGSLINRRYETRVANTSAFPLTLPATAYPASSSSNPKLGLPIARLPRPVRLEAGTGSNDVTRDREAGFTWPLPP